MTADIQAAHDAEVARLMAHPYLYKFEPIPMTPELKDLINRAHRVQTPATSPDASQTNPNPVRFATLTSAAPERER